MPDTAEPRIRPNRAQTNRLVTAFWGELRLLEDRSFRKYSMVQLGEFDMLADPTERGIVTRVQRTWWKLLVENGWARVSHRGGDALEPAEFLEAARAADFGAPLRLTPEGKAAMYWGCARFGIDPHRGLAPRADYDIAAGPRREPDPDLPDVEQSLRTYLGWEGTANTGHANSDHLGTGFGRELR